jgi:uncharacterized protein (DUF433 family)
MIDRITANPKILGGKPIIKGTRISVEFILDLLTSDVTEVEILQGYPHLKKDDIQACLKYAALSCKAAGRYLNRRGGNGGYMIITQTDSQEYQKACRERAANMCIRVAWEEIYETH